MTRPEIKSSKKTYMNPININDFEIIDCCPLSKTGQVVVNKAERKILIPSDIFYISLIRLGFTWDECFEFAKRQISISINNNFNKEVDKLKI